METNVNKTIRKTKKYDIRNDMKELKIKNWTSCIQDHSYWKLYVEKAKAFNDWICKEEEEEEEDKLLKSVKISVNVTKYQKGVYCLGVKVFNILPSYIKTEFDNCWDPCLTSSWPWNIFGCVWLCSGHITRELPFPTSA